MSSYSISSSIREQFGPLTSSEINVAILYGGQSKFDMKRINPLQIAVYVLVMSVLLSGCGAAIDRDITFYGDEVWEAEMRIGIPNEILAIYGTPDALDVEMRKEVAKMEQLGAKASWKRSREDYAYQYTISLEGDGFDLLNDIVFDGSANIYEAEVDGRQTIYFTNVMTPDILGASQNVITIHAGEILESNGVVEGGTVQWANPMGTINATFTPKGGTNFGMLFIVVLIAAVIGGVGWYFWKQTSPEPAVLDASKLTASSVRCISCGKSIDQGAKFCPHCGEEQGIS